MTAHSIILTWLEKELFEGNLRLGQDLPDDRTIATATGLTHSAAREGLKHLEDMGIVRLYEGRKKTIISQLVEDPVASAAPALRLHTAQAKYPVRDLVQARMLIEGWAAENADAQHPAFAEAHEVLEAMQEPNIGLGEFYELEVAFHVALVRASGNGLMSGLMGALRPGLFDYLMSIAGTSGLWSATTARLRSEHRAALDAIEFGDNGLAATLVRAQIRSEYEEAGIDLDAPRIPEVEEDPVSSLEPVTVDDTELFPKDPGFSVSPDLIEALNSIEPVAIPLGDAADETSEPLSEGQDAPDGAEPDAAYSAAVSDRGETQQLGPGVVAEASTLESEENRELPQREANAVESRKIPGELTTNTDELLVVRADKPGRRRSGTVSTPVHATVIKPVARKSQPTGIIGGQVAPASQQSNGADTDNILRAKPRPSAHLPSSAELMEQHKQRENTEHQRGFFSWRRKNRSASAEDAESTPESEKNQRATESSPEILGAAAQKPCETAPEPAVMPDAQLSAPATQEQETSPVEPLHETSLIQRPVEPDSTSEHADTQPQASQRTSKIKRFFGWGVNTDSTASVADASEENQHEVTDTETSGAVTASEPSSEVQQQVASVEDQPNHHEPEPSLADEPVSDSSPSSAKSPIAGKGATLSKNKGKKKKKRKR
ncbi:FadR/GntR family transcriptional regulator [Rothia sp. ZJ1223]|uniref:FadR/GntR family transcriptional regulator n=1 Tax=Rothia sp. ZJ1223 TaxID=2811098 RepID=UPI00195E73A8|nr:FCD domain-containing protein [Rothia sp. ZJ1223]MBM7051950.1 FadR family transcriptional regulator [Rothia sp. ZJ1223]